jgi:uncharacterized membrane protein YhaH (DUF805 family)
MIITILIIIMMIMMKVIRIMVMMTHDTNNSYNPDKKHDNDCYRLLSTRTLLTNPAV